jgi:DNA polymerase
MSSLSQLNQEILTCTKCALAQGRTRVVPGEGPEDAQLMFIGEAPGWNEDQQGRPFVGAAGQFLEQLLATIGLKRQQVVIANVIKCRPPGNRDPLPEEILACRPWLQSQIEIISPRMIITLGRFAMSMFFPGKSIGKIHGIPEQRDGIIYFPMYHPAAALHQGSLRRTIEADMLKIPTLLQEPVSQPPPAEEPPHQLSLFGD